MHFQRVCPKNYTLTSVYEDATKSYALRVQLRNIDMMHQVMSYMLTSMSYQLQVCATVVNIKT